MASCPEAFYPHMNARPQTVAERLSGRPEVGLLKEAASTPAPGPRLAKSVLANGDDFAVEDVLCHSGRSGWSIPELSLGFAIVFPRRGFLCRRVEGVETALDPTVVYFELPGQEQEIAHPLAGGDACTSIVLSAALVASVWGGELGVPDGPLFSNASVDLEHRFLLSAARRGCDQFELDERVVSLVANVLEQGRPKRVAAGRPATVAARRTMVEGARATIVAEPWIGLIELARRLSVSPHHLSRLFRDGTGETVSRHRNRVRVRLALERLAEGEQDLARLAAELGFADHAHLTRVVGREAGSPPSRLRTLLSAADAQANTNQTSPEVATRVAPCSPCGHRGINDALSHDHSPSITSSALQ